MRFREGEGELSFLNEEIDKDCFYIEIGILPCSNITFTHIVELTTPWNNIPRILID